MGRKQHQRSKQAKLTQAERQEFDRWQKRHDSIALLQKRLSDLPERDRGFAINLSAQYNTTGALSVRQWPYVLRFAASIHLLDTMTIQSARREQLVKSETHRQEDRRSGGCFVYGILSGDQVKIGISREPKRRIRDLQTAHGSPLELLWSVQAATRLKAKNIEARLHKHFAPARLKGEWFSAAIAEQAKMMAGAMSTNDASGNKARWPVPAAVHRSAG